MGCFSSKCWSQILRENREEIEKIFLFKNSLISYRFLEQKDKDTRLLNDKVQSLLFFAGHNMTKRSRSNRRTSVRRLQIEDLQSREMMAADCCAETVTPASASQAVLTESALAAASSSVAATSSVVAANTDAGSSIRTALDLGTVNSSAAVRGSVNFADRVDVFRFDVTRSGAVDINVTGLSRNVDLVFADESGALIETSRNRGSLNESISADLDAGTYFVGIQTRSFRGSSYELGIDVQLVQPEIDPRELDPDELDLLTSLPDVQYFGGSREWNINAVNAPEAWAAGFSGEGITVAVVDTGIDLDHPDLVSNLYVNAGEIAGNGIDDDGNGFVDDVHGYDFASGDADPNDVGGHGTHVAGTIAAGLNGFGATGVAPDATILPVRVLGDNGSGSTNAVAAGIRYAAEQGADIINLSLGGGFSRVIQSAIDYAQDLGSFIVAAAGNEGASAPGFPARFSSIYDNVLSVGAHNSSNQLAGFSNDVGSSGSVQIDAPGVGVFSTYVGGRYATLSGTSMAAPHVAGVAALALSANPNLTPAQLRDLLVGGVTDAAIGSDAIGIVNAATTVAYAAAGLTAPPTESVASSFSSSSSGGELRSSSSDGAIVAGPSVVLASAETSSVGSETQDVSSVETSTVEKQSSFFVASATEQSSADLIDIIVENSEPDPTAVDELFDGDFVNSLV